MKNYIAVLFISVAVVSACNNGEKQTPRNDNAGDTAKAKQLVLDITKDKHYLWEININDSSGALKLTRAEPVEEDSLTASFVISKLNKRYPDIHIEYTRISGDTIFVRIPKSAKLTRQMGSTGADSYMAEATYNLSELKNVNYVNFDFKKGEHAEPGVYTKTDFAGLLK